MRVTAPRVFSVYNSFLITQAVYERQRLVAKQIQQIHVSLELVSAPDPHVTPSRKRVWYLTSEF